MPDGIPDTLSYMVLGYVLAGIVFSVLLIYLVAKARRIRAESKMLDELESDNSPR
ncbi:MAG: hypothetical protein IT323_21800 [Anaerolineae bacterium]|nr:hypothetical protein [Anaerolineae bacterium]